MTASRCQTLCRAAAATLGFAVGTCVASPALAVTVDWAHGCMPFIPQAEGYYHLPPGLLEAIALTESGQDGAPFPWALNIAGQAFLPSDYQAAARMLRLPDGHPRRDVAIGCMQIHMQYHLEKFVQPEWALHPRYNVWYAAAYLDQLQRTYGDWISAIAHYHGSAPAAQQQYVCRVADKLRITGPQTRVALGLQSCGNAAMPIRNNRHVSAKARARAAMMVARRVGRIIILGRDRY